MTAEKMLYQCPDCGRPVVFRHRDTTIFLCTCGTVVKRTEDGGITGKAFNVILEKQDLIQPGATGWWQNKLFVVEGRFRAWMDEYLLNYWTIAFPDGSLKYLVESYGMYEIHEPSADRTVLSSIDLRIVKPGERKKIDNETFLLQNRDKCFRWEVEGELLLPECNSTFQIFEFVSSAGKRFCFIEFLPGYVISYKVNLTSFNDLKLEKLRTVGDSEKSIVCSHCSKDINVISFPYAQSYACGHCGSRYSLKNAIDFHKHPERNKTDEPFAVKIGIRGVINGIDYKVVGAVLKEENNQYSSKWKEYTLYNKAEGFAFLSEYNGHWIYIRETADCPVLLDGDSRGFHYGKDLYRLFNSYTSIVINAVGEFPYNIYNDRHKQALEFICPPRLWIRERSNEEGIRWFKGIHIGTKELENAFGNDIVLPYQEGMGAVEPGGYISGSRMAMAAFIGVLGLLFLHIFTSFTCSERVIANEEFLFVDSSGGFSTVIKDLKLEKRSSNVLFEIQANVDNSWFELEANLVNTDNGTEYGLNKGVEFYSGYSEGEYWTEGTREETARLNEIPAGNYILQIQGSRDFNSYYASKLQVFSLKVIYDTPNHRNFLICMALLLIWPVIRFLVIRQNEKDRWSNSPFSTYE